MALGASSGVTSSKVVFQNQYANFIPNELDKGK
jgi:hypothetical protein